MTEIAVPDLAMASEHGTAMGDDAAGALAARDEMERAFRRLTEDQRTLLALLYYADLPLADVAIAMGVPVGTIKSRHHRAMAALRAALAADGRTPELANGQPA